MGKSNKSMFSMDASVEHGEKASVQPGEMVQVRSYNEILGTLDEFGTFEELPFMPEMRQYTGRTFRVSRCFGKVFVEGAGNRRIANTVMLDGAVCDGESHDHCKRTCNILWKETWLNRVDDSSVQEPIKHLKRNKAYQPKKFFCQLTCLKEATSRLPMSFEDIFRQYLAVNLSFGPPKKIINLLLRLNYNIMWLLGRKRYAKLRGRLPRFQTPSVSLNLLPGDLVQVKSKEDILSTLDWRGRNSGLRFTDEMLKYCGRRYRVLKRVDRMIVDDSLMREIANTVYLEGVICDGSDHGNCPLGCLSLWREIWLERV